MNTSHKKPSVWRRIARVFRSSRDERTELTCDEVRDLSSEYLAREQTREAMTDRLFDRVQRHLGGCAPCRSFVEGLRRTVNLLTQLPPAHAPEELRKRLLDQSGKL